MPEQEYLTKEKYKELSEELDQLKKVKRREIAENLEYAKSLGDLSENAEYQEAREMQAEIEERIAKLELIIKHATIVAHKKSDIVGVGSVIVLEREGDKQKFNYTIVGSEESNIAQGKVSTSSPLVAAMMGKKKGDTFAFKTPKGEVRYKIVSVE
jgi:transcription elongation factor GreA